MSIQTRYYRWFVRPNKSQVDETISQVRENFKKIHKQEPWLNLIPATPRDSETIENMFTCNICLQVVTDPIRCGSCKNLNCTDCMGKWIKQNKGCPNCLELYRKAR